MENNNSGAKRHYFDWAATSPFDFTFKTEEYPLYGNPSSHHTEGKLAKQALEDARTRCAAVLNVPPEKLYFTSGGTESNSIALFSNLMRKSQGRIIYSAAEHSSVREGINTLEKMGKPCAKIAIDSEGKVTPELLEKIFDKYNDARFASIMAVNNETGTVTDIPAIRDILRKQNAPVHFHCDLVQAAGKIPVDIEGWDLDSASISAHKIGGPQGIGLLYLKKPFEAFYTGGGQERSIRGGTENTLGAVAMASCLEKHTAPEVVLENYEQAQTRWDKLINALNNIERCTLIPQTRKQLSPNCSLLTANCSLFSPYILQAAFKNIPGEVMARALDDMGFAVSTGSACSSSSPERPVLLAMGVEENLRIEGIRISQGWATTDEEIDLLVNAILEVLKFL